MGDSLCVLLNLSLLGISCINMQCPVTSDMFLWMTWVTLHSLYDLLCYHRDLNIKSGESKDSVHFPYSCCSVEHSILTTLYRISVTSWRPTKWWVVGTPVLLSWSVSSTKCLPVGYLHRPDIWMSCTEKTHFTWLMFVIRKHFFSLAEQIFGILLSTLRKTVKPLSLPVKYAFQ